MPAQAPGRGTRRSLRIGPYVVEAPLALGTLGSAYRAGDPASGRAVALKVLPPEIAAPAARTATAGSRSNSATSGCSAVPRTTARSRRVRSSTCR
jgi:hypothetical protein